MRVSFWWFTIGLVTGALCALPAPLVSPLQAQSDSTPIPALSPSAVADATTYSTTNLRAAPDARAAIVERLDAGVAVVLQGRDETGQWVYVRVSGADTDSGVGGELGWLPVFALTLTLDVLLLPITVGAGITPTPIGEGELVDDSAPRASAYGRVNVRAVPTIDSEVVAVLNTGDSASVSARSSANNDWLRVETEAGSGWVAYFTVRVEGELDSLPILVPDSSSGALIPPALVVRTRFNARLHQAPALDSAVVAIVPFASEVTPVARSADRRWLFLRYQAVSGWGAAGLFAIDADSLDALPLYVTMPGAAPLVSPTLMPPGAG